MKRLIALLIIIGFSLSLDSCKIVTTGNQGKHKGWFKNTSITEPTRHQYFQTTTLDPKSLKGLLPKSEARDPKSETNTKIKILMFKTVLTASG